MALSQGRILFLGLTLLLASFSASAQTGCEEPMLMTSSTSPASTTNCEPVAQPGPVSSISASPSTSYDGTFAVSWSAASNMITSGFDAWGYELKEYKSGVLTQTFTVSPTITNYLFSNKSNGSYQYQVRGCNQSQGVPTC